MNAIAFGTKRAFHGFLRITRKALQSVGLTAARFDMMCALLGAPRHQHEVATFSVRQSVLRHTLGVSASVVSRMLRALESLGLVVRRRAREDRRQYDVSLTESGDQRIRVARRLLLRGVQRIVYQCICMGRHKDPNERFRHMDVLESYLHVLRRDFGDTATLYYPWGHPDD
ncbi:MAG TPA: MarR family winged helix-turn-helix transcriptional regulator [Polyangiaceae bacterium]|jgi:DNA-binding MarR family transcriptional regulator